LYIGAQFQIGKQNTASGMRTSAISGTEETQGPTISWKADAECSEVLPCPYTLIFRETEKQLTVSVIMNYYGKS
jgi:hypothetical protein